MFGRTPHAVRERLWHAKERAVQWFVHRGFADSLHTRLAQQLTDARIDLVLDVGANEGHYARLMRRLGFSGTIISFEPIASVAAALEREAQRDGNWRVVQCALGSRNETMPLHVTAGNVFSSLLVPNEFGRREFGAMTEVSVVEQVAVRRLDTALEELGVDAGARRIHLKTDTQGYDLEVIRGAGDTLDRVHSLQCEISLRPIYDKQTPWLAMLQELTDKGFGLVGMFAVARDAKLRMIEADALFRR